MKVEDFNSMGVWLRAKNGGKTVGVSMAEGGKVPPEVVRMVADNKESLLEELNDNKKVMESLKIPLPGDELERLLPQVNPGNKGCGCKDYKNKMNRWGVKGCRKHYDEILKHLIDQAGEYIPMAGLIKPVVRVAAKRYLDKAIQACTSTVVWVYWHGGADSDELRYSMRSALKNLPDASNFVVCGDRPPWYTGQFIRSPRYGRADAVKEFGTGRFSKWIDSIIKLQNIIQSSMVTDNFLWMYDDTFIVKETTIRNISIPRFNGMLHSGRLMEPEKRKWREVRRRTAVALMDRGMNQRNFSTHYPVVYNKNLLSETIEYFDARKKARCIESLYMNHHYDHAQGMSGLLQYRKRSGSSFQVNQHAEVVNVGGFKGEIAEAIRPMFSEKADWEND